MDLPNLEAGGCTDIFFDEDTIVKTSRLRMPLDEAEAMRSSLVDYAAILADEPVEIAGLRSTSLVQENDKYRVRHVSEVVYGPSVLSLRGEERQTAVAKAASGIAAMTVVGNVDRVVVGLDGTTKNWHVKPDGTPVLVDLYPPLVRDDNNALHFGNVPSNSEFYERYMGTKSGLLAKLLFSAHNDNYPALSVGDCVRQVWHGAEDWAYDTLPTDMDPSVRDAVRAELRMRFLPLLGNTATKLVRAKIARLM